MKSLPEVKIDKKLPKKTESKIYFVKIGLLETPYYKKELKNRAMEEISRGDSLNQKKAVQILLELETGYMPKDYKPTTTTIDQSYFAKFLFYGLIVCILLSYRPKTIIGIGGNSSKYKFMMWWIKIISVTIPSVILIPIIQSKLTGLF